MTEEIPKIPCPSCMAPMGRLETSEGLRGWCCLRCDTAGMQPRHAHPAGFETHVLPFRRLPLPPPSLVDPGGSLVARWQRALEMLVCDGRCPWCSKAMQLVTCNGGLRWFCTTECSK